MRRMMFPALIQELDNAVTHGTSQRRAEILARITDIFVASSDSFSTNQIELFDDVFVRITAVIELSARAMLANRLAKEPRAPYMICHVLASHDEIDIAGPVLEQSQQLDNEFLVATAQSKSQKHLLAISRRSSIDEAVTDVLVERGDQPVVLSTASNPAARFSDHGYMTLVNRSVDDDELTTRVALRRDIPREHLLRLLVRASHDVQLKLEAAHPSMANMIQSAVAEAATMILDKAGTLSRNYVVARMHIETLLSDGQLGESQMAAFAATNKFEETAVALAVLSGLTIEAVDRAMVQDRPDAVLVMAKSIGMSWPTTKAILRMRAGARGISPGELEQCESTFSRLKPATARQVIEFQRKRTSGSRFTRSAA
jgi:uncharacterized protein (DUF2336 family)